MHPTITDAAVIGVDFSDGRGELPRAYLVIDPTSSPTITDGEIHNHMSGHLAKYKALAGGIERLDAIPRSASGKILKRILREKAELWRPSSCEMAIVRTKSRTAAPRGRPPPGEAPSEKEISKTEDCQLAANAVHAPESDASESTLYGGHGHGHDTIGSTAGKRKHLPGAGTAEVCGSRQSKKTKTGISAR